LILGQELLVLDEPTIGQDRRNAMLLLAICEELHRAGKTIVMITHDMRLVAEHARTVRVLVDGAVAFAGPPAGLFADAALLARAHLQPPPMLELSQRLFDAQGPESPSVAAGCLPTTVEALAGVLTPSVAGIGR
jgi:ABC-type multidrug transport system ATPase subunit